MNFGFSSEDIGLRPRRTILVIIALFIIAALLLIYFLPNLFKDQSTKTFTNTVVIYYDDGSTSPKYRAYQDTVANLMGHFKLFYIKKPISSYRKGYINNYRATFYIGNVSGSTVPNSFREDVLVAKRPVIWLNFNLKQIAGSTAFKSRFENKYRLRFVDQLGSSAYRTVTYQGKKFKRFANPITKVKVLNSTVVKVKARAGNGSSSIPYILKSGYLWYVADNPFELWYEDQPYIAFTDVLHDILGVSHATSRRALVRIEDVDAEDDPERLKAIADYLHSQNVPFSVGVIARFYDPLGATGPKRETDLDKAPDVVEALKYMVSKGGTLIMHGYTHQYDSTRNPDNGVTGYDYEFSRNLPAPGTSVNVLRPESITPVPGDSTTWVQGRINKARAIFDLAGLPQPTIWETPHYSASIVDLKVFAKNFPRSYERMPEAYFPYVLHRTVYGNKLIPENLGYMSPGGVDPSAIVAGANRNLAVRDGFASFFFHPQYDIALLKSAISGIKSKGYRFVNVNSL